MVYYERTRLMDGTWRPGLRERCVLVLCKIESSLSSKFIRVMIIHFIDYS